MADKIDSITIGNSTWDIDLPSDARPSIASLTASETIQAQTFNARSDARLKENIIEYKPVESILDLPVFEYDFKGGNGHRIGCLAQDLQKICPELVHEGCDGYLTIEESKIVYPLLLEVRKLRAEVEELKRR